MDKRPIGVFDSGVGGLTTVRELHRLLPEEDIIYFGDTGRVPYGTRGRDVIRKYAIQDIRFLLRHDVKAIVAACNTVSANLSSEDVRQLGIDLPFTEPITPAARKACSLSPGGRIGVIATPAAIRTAAYERAVRSISPDVQIFGRACPMLVPLVENGMTGTDNQIARLTLEMYLEPLIRERVDTLILGCTHYPLLSDLIRDILGDGVALVDSGAAAAREVKETMAAAGMLAEKGHTGRTAYKVTDAVEGFVEVAGHFLDRQIAGDVEYVDISIIEEEWTEPQKAGQRR